MDPEQELIGQMGLLLTQLRYTRRAMEDVERSTARYGGVGFAGALQAGPHFGEPPLLNGALKVYIVNINDLAPGSGFGGFLEGLLGGIGRFFGGFLGGLAGGTVSGVLLPVMLAQLAHIASTVERIIDRLGLRGSTATPGARPAPQTAQAAASATQGPNLTAALPEITRTVQALTGLFTAASAGPERAGQAGSAPESVAGARWLDLLDGVSTMLQGITHVIDGLIILVPILVGTLASLIVRLDNIKLALVDLLQFALRNVFLLRGVTLVTIYDTISGLAALGANLLGIVGTAVERVLTAVFRIIGELLQVALQALAFISNGIQHTIDALLRWLVGAVGAILTFLGDTRIFRVIVHVIQAIPAIIPPLYRLIRGGELPRTEAEALTKIANEPIPGPATPGVPAALPPFPDLAATLTPPQGVADLATAVADAGRGITSNVRSIFNTAQRTLRDVGTALNDSATVGESGFTTGLNMHIEAVRNRATTLANELAGARQAAAERPQTGMEAIAQAYEGWLAGGGLRMILGNITDYFQRNPGLVGEVVGQTGAERPRATVEIQEVIIDVEPPAAPAPTRHNSSSGVAPFEDSHELLERGGGRPGQWLPSALLA